MYCTTEIRLYLPRKTFFVCKRNINKLCLHTYMYYAGSLLLIVNENICTPQYLLNILQCTSSQEKANRKGHNTTQNLCIKNARQFCAD